MRIFTTIELKDIGYLAKCCGLVCHHWNDFDSFLEGHEYITNKLACLVRSALNLDYIKVIIASVASIGLHLIEPFYVKTISVDATHSFLKEFFTNLYNSLCRPDLVDRSWFEFNVPKLEGVSQRVFDCVKQDSYGQDVVNSVSQLALLYENDCINLVKLFLPDLAVTLARQRGKYYGFGTFPAEFPVFEQVHGQNVDNTPVNNMDMERTCGDLDNKLRQKSNNLKASSRSVVMNKVFNILPTPQDLPDFHSMRHVARKIDEIELEWTERQRALRAVGLNNKEAQLLLKEQKKLADLRLLRNAGGPFTTADEIDAYLASNDDLTAKAQRMRREVTYARDTSVSFPRNHQVFRIMNTSVTPRRLLTPQEFGVNLKLYLGKQEDRTVVSLDEYRRAVASLS